MAARVLAGNPLRFARGERDLAVDRQRELQRDSRTSKLEPGEPAGERAPRFIAPDAELHLDSRIAKATNALARRARVWVFQSDHHPVGLRGDEQVGAIGTARAVMRARLERGVYRRT